MRRTSGGGRPAPGRWLGLLVALVWAAFASGAGAQSTLDLDPRGPELDREELQEMLDRLELAASSPGYGDALRRRAAEEAEVVRTRLREGDFQVGDRIALDIVGEPLLPDTVVVNDDRAIQLADMGQISLNGVLRSELEEHLTRELSRFIQDPEVQATGLIRVAVLGSVGRQGFYTMPASVLIEEAIMRAGGPAQNADLDGTEIVRGDEVIWRGDALKTAMIEGRTLDQLSLRAGDRIMVPSQGSSFWSWRSMRAVLFTIPPLLYLFRRLTR